MNYPPSLQKLVEELSKLPSIGRKTASRLAFFMIEHPQDAQALAQSIFNVKNSLSHCKQCFGLSESDLCSICNNSTRDSEILCVVESAYNIFTIESSSIFKGYYHVLGGIISPMKGIGPSNLNICSLKKRVETQKIQELIIATNPTVEGEATAHYLMHELEDKVPLISRIAKGIPSGSDLEYIDQSTLVGSFEGRRSL